MKGLALILKHSKDLISFHASLRHIQPALGNAIGLNKHCACSTTPINDIKPHEEGDNPNAACSPSSPEQIGPAEAEGHHGANYEGILQPRSEFSPSEIGRLCRGLRLQGHALAKELLLTDSFNHKLRGNLAILRDLGMTIGDQKTLVLGSHWFASTPPEVLEEKIKWLKRQFGLDSKETSDVLLRHPSVIEYSLDVNVDPILSMLREAGFDQGMIKSMVVNYPKMLGVARDDIQVLMDIFTTVGFSKSEFLTVVQRNPEVLRMDTEKGVKPFLQGLKKLEIKDEDAVKLLMSAPGLIMCDLEHKIAPMLSWFETALGLEREDVVHNVFLKIPKLFVSNRIGQFKRVVKALESYGLTSPEYRIVLQQQPQLLGRAFGGKMAQVHLRLKFLKEILRKEPRDLVTYPPYISHSLDNHIMYRVAVLDKQGIKYSGYSLEDLFGSSLEDFNANKLANPSQFRAWWVKMSREEKLNAIKTRTYMSC